MPFSEPNARAMPTTTLGAAIILRLPRAAIDSNLGFESAASRERLARGGRSAVLHANSLGGLGSPLAGGSDGGCHKL
jgi:hypothetical protein